MPKKILIVDDEPDLLALAVLRLETSGYEVLTAKNSEEALASLRKNIPDLILLDLLLPKMQGDEFCKKIKSDIKFKHIPVVLFTASIVRVPAKVKEMGADDYVLKPFSADELLCKVKKLTG